MNFERQGANGEPQRGISVSGREQRKQRLFFGKVFSDKLVRLERQAGTPEQIVTISRSATALSREAAIRDGLDLFNSKSPFDEGRKGPPGAFFFVNVGNRGYAWYAEDEVKSHGGGVPVLIEIDITSENFGILGKKIRGVDKTTSNYEFPKMKSFNTLEAVTEKGGTGEVVLDMQRLSRNDLVKLGVKVGFKGENGEYEFKMYEEWAKELGIT